MSIFFKIEKYRIQLFSFRMLSSPLCSCCSLKFMIENVYKLSFFIFVIDISVCVCDGEKFDIENFDTKLEFLIHLRNFSCKVEG